MHLVDPLTRSFAFLTPIHFHLLRPLELLPLHKKIKIMTLLNPYPKKVHPNLLTHPPNPKNIFPSTTTVATRKQT
jgi:hypothetical protein